MVRKQAPKRSKGPREASGSPQKDTVNLSVVGLFLLVGSIFVVVLCLCLMVLSLFCGTLIRIDLFKG